MTTPHEGDEQAMPHGGEIEAPDEGSKGLRSGALSELPLVAALLVAAVVVALLAAGGPVLELIHGLKTLWLG